VPRRPPRRPGHFAVGFNPLPANFQDNGTIAQLTESFVFWRVAKGGPGCRARARRELGDAGVGGFLTEREIWSVILFLYEQTGGSHGRGRNRERRREVIGGPMLALAVLLSAQDTTPANRST